MLTKKEISDIHEKIKTCKIGIIGDFCVDIYWHADMRLSELSRETPHYPLPVTSEKMSLGAAGNVAANLAALCPEKIYAVGLTGNDWRGTVLRGLLKDIGISDSLFLTSNERFTNAYCKPMRHGISKTVFEDPRLDFETRFPISKNEEELIISNLRFIADKIDVLCVADQFGCGIITQNVRDEIIKLAKNGLTVICDSRYNIGKFTDCILKPNEIECMKAVHGPDCPTDFEENDIIAAARKLSQRNNARVFCTLGDKGSYIRENSGEFRISAKKIDGEVDICGAGDTSLAAFSLAVCAEYPLDRAARFAALASAVTVQKIGMTGTATIDEIKALAI